VCGLKFKRQQTPFSLRYSFIKEKELNVCAEQRAHSYKVKRKRKMNE
jgi:hypothetical protein